MLNIFCDCSSLTSITIGNSVTLIGYGAFYDCSGLTSVTLSGYGQWNLSTSSDFPFSQIKTLNIGSGITSIGKLGVAPTTINCYAETPPTCSSGTFTNYTGELHVPSSAIAAYMTADYWKNFTNLVFDANDKITLSQTSASLTQWDELALLQAVNPESAALTWSSTNPSVATVSDAGVVTAVAPGACDIHVTMADNPAVYAKCHITATYPEITLALSEEETEMNVGDELALTAIITPDNKGLTPTWTSSDESVATVDANGKVTAVGEGECDITATVLDQTATCHVTVNAIAITITLSMDNATIKPNEILTLYPTCTPDVMVDFTVSSSDPTVAFARVIDRPAGAPAMGAPALASSKAIQIVGIKDGTANVTVGSVDGKATPATIEVNVSTMTGIEDINVDNSGKHQRYNVLGQPVDDTYRGIVIENGKKIMVR